MARLLSHGRLSGPSPQQAAMDVRVKVEPIESDVVPEDANLPALPTLEQVDERETDAELESAVEM